MKKYLENRHFFQFTYCIFQKAVVQYIYFAIQVVFLLRLFYPKEKKYNEEMINDTQINKKENCTTSTKKEKKNLYAQNTKQSKNLIKYTKAQCVQTLFQNKPNQENKQYQCSDAPIKTKDTTSDKKNFKKIIILSPHKLSFEIQKSDCIQISNKKAKKNKLNIS